MYLVVCVSPWHVALQHLVNPKNGCLLEGGVHTVHICTVSLLHQRRKTGAIQSLFKLPHKLKQSPVDYSVCTFVDADNHHIHTVRPMGPDFLPVSLLH